MAITYSQQTLELLEYLYEHSDEVISNSKLPNNIVKPEIRLLQSMAQRKHVRLLNTATKDFTYQIDDEGKGYIEAYRKEEAERQEAKRLNLRSARYSAITVAVAVAALFVSIAGAVAAFLQIWT